MPDRTWAAPRIAALNASSKLTPCTIQSCSSAPSDMRQDAIQPGAASLQTSLPIKGLSAPAILAASSRSDEAEVHFSASSAEGKMTLIASGSAASAKDSRIASSRELSRQT